MQARNCFQKSANQVVRRLAIAALLARVSYVLKT